jgi:hypothetical protein
VLCGCRLGLQDEDTAYTLRAKWKRIPLVVVGCLAAAAGLRPAAQEHGREKPQNHKDLRWTPPDVNAPLRSLLSIPPCDLTKVLKDVGAHALELTGNLENFTAQEKIEYAMMNPSGLREESDSGLFEYVFVFERVEGVRTSREFRTPSVGSHTFPATGQDTGQVALGLIFHPNMQSDYDMMCLGQDKWNGQLAWVIQFQQRKEKPRRTLQFRSEGVTYAGMLKGRAWISMDGAQIVHLETSLMKDIPEMNVRSSVVSVDYGPVQIQSRKLELWLPQRVEAYWEISSRRVILYHTFSNFKLFSVDTEQNVEKPKQP